MARTMWLTSTPPAPSHSSKLQRLARAHGVTVAGIELSIPDMFRRKFAAGWVEHIPLTYLMDLACKRPAIPKFTQDTLSFTEATGMIQAISRLLSGKGKNSLKFTNWFQAWKHLIKLIMKFLPEEHPAWIINFDIIHLKDGLSLQWHLWLAYDIEV